MNVYDHLSKDDDYEQLIENAMNKTYLDELDVEYDFIDYLGGEFPKGIDYFAITILLHSGKVIDITIEDEEFEDYANYESAEEYEHEFDAFIPTDNQYCNRMINKIKSEFADVLEVMITEL